MKGISLIIIAIVISSINLIGQSKIYELKIQKDSADINYGLFNLFGDFEIYENDQIKWAFKPIEGDFSVYVFVATFTGDSYDGTKKIFNDYLILKTEIDSNRIIDGYQYTLEWAEPPAISDLYRITNKNTELIDNLEIEELEMKLVRSDYIIDWKQELNEKALIQIQ